MSPTLESGDVLVGLHLFSLQRGDVVVFKPNGQVGSVDYIKRVIAVPGDSLRIDHARVFINGP